MFDLIAQGFALAFDPRVLFLLFAGVLAGNVVASIPGLGSTQAIALFLPFSFYMDPLPALAFITGLYTGGNFGGAIPAVLLGTPGSPEAAATMLDGYPMGQKGQAGKALKQALWSGTTADLLAGLTLMFGAAALAPFALKIGAPEQLAIVVFALTAIAVVSQGSMLKGFVAAFIGLLLSTVGMDPFTGQPRLTFGVLAFTSGIELIPLIIGLFAISEVVYQFTVRSRHATSPTVLRDDGSFGWRDYKASWRETGIGSVVGITSAIIPGLGAGIATFISYSIAKQVSRVRDKFGTGVPQGVAAVEAANSGTVGPTLIPLITLGIPGSGNAALYMAAFLLQGVRVGPTAMQQHGPLIYGLFAIFLFGTVANFTGGYVIRSFAPHLLRIPPKYVYPAVLAVTMVGTYAINTSVVDVWVALGFGFVGYGMRRAQIPLPPLLIAFILGSLMERALRRSLLLHGGSMLAILGRPIVLVFLSLSVAVIVGVAVRGRRERARDRGHSRSMSDPPTDPVKTAVSDHGDD